MEPMEQGSNDENNENILTNSSDDAPLSKLVSPLKKRRRRSSPEKDREDDEDDGATCAICMDNFQSVGDHRIVALKCGHIFGESCIRRWLHESQQPKSCPQCKTKATVRDMRFIYATKIRVLDNTRELELAQQVMLLQQEKAKLAMDSSVLTVTVKSQKTEITSLQKEIQILMMKSSAMLTTGQVIAGVRSIKRGKIFLEKNVDFKENLESRLMKYLSKNRKLVVTQKASTALFQGFGIKLVDINNNYRQEKFIITSNKTVNDLSLDSNESCVITASKETSCKMYSISTNASVNCFTPANVPIWSCAFDSERQQYVYLGGQNGVTYIYDTRMPSAVFKEVVAVDHRSPVKYTIPMKKTENFLYGGFFVVHMSRIYFYEYLASGEVVSHKLNINEPIIVASYDDRTEMLLVTKSPSGSGATFKPIRHCLCKLLKEKDTLILQEIYSYNGSNSNLPTFSRPSQIKVPDGVIVASYLQDTKMLQIRSPTVSLLHETNVTDTIVDICPFYLDNGQFFGALSNSRCRVFKINLDY